MAEQDFIKTVCQNRKARHDYEISETMEAGMVLLGPEVKSLRAGRANLGDSYARIKQGELILYHVHISEYPYAHDMPLDPLRPRKLLLHRGEIQRLIGRTKEKGFTLIPLKIYFKQGRAKVELALVRGRKKIDKRQEIKKRDEKREMDRKYRIKQ